MIIIGKDTAYASNDGTTAENITTPDDLADGSIAVFGKDQGADQETLITTTNASAFAGRFIRIFQGRASGSPIVSPFIDLEGNKNIVSSEYAAPAKVQYNVEMPATIEEPDNERADYMIHIIQDTIAGNRERWTISTQGKFANSDAGKTALAEALKAAADDIDTLPVDVTLTGDVPKELLITAKDFGEIIFVAVDDGLSLAPVSTTVAFEKGSGSGAEVVEAEKDSFSQRGIIDRIDSRLRTPGLNADENGTYDLYHLEATIETHNALRMNNGDGKFHNITFAFPDLLPTAAASVGKNQYSFEGILTDLGFTYDSIAETSG